MMNMIYIYLQKIKMSVFKYQRNFKLGICIKINQNIYKIKLKKGFSLKHIIININNYVYN